MGFLSKLKGELVDIIEWTDSASNTLVYRFPRYHHEIKYGAKLTVREGQNAVFINEGQLADVFSPGMYTLETQNLPILSALKGWKYGFQSPFKAEVYFVNMRRILDQKWGTKNPIMLRDAEFGPLRLRAFGTYTFRVTDPALFMKTIVGTDGHFTAEEINGQLRNILVARFADALGEAKIPALDLAANYNELGARLEGLIQPEFGGYGVELGKLLIENVSLPPAVEEALDKRSSMGVIGNMQAYTQYQAATALGDAANNPGGAGGLAAGGLAAGVGLAMGGQMAQTLTQPGTAGAPPPAVPPPPPAATVYHVVVNGQQQGPYSMGDLQQMAAQGQLRPEMLLWKAGMAQWTAAGSVPETAGLFPPAVPPPPPPPPAS